MCLFLFPPLSYTAMHTSGMATVSKNADSEIFVVLDLDLLLDFCAVGVDTGSNVSPQCLVRLHAERRQCVSAPCVLWALLSNVHSLPGRKKAKVVWILSVHVSFLFLSP